MTWSYSRIKSFEDCPYRWFLTYILEEEKQTNFYSEYGKLMHTLLELFYKDIITKEEMAEYFQEYYPDYSTVDGMMPNASIVRSYFNKGSSYINNFERFEYNTVETEKEVKFTIEDKNFVGYIDYLGEKDGNLVIIDHKSRNMKPRSKRGRYTKGDQLIDEMLVQLYLYSVAIKEEYGKYPSKLIFNCFNENILIEEDFKMEAYKEATEWAINEIARIEDMSEFIPRPEFFKCNFLCDMNSECCFNDMY